MMPRSLASLNLRSQAHLNPCALVRLYHVGMSIGARFRELRLHLELTGEEVGAICDVTKAMVSHWENNDNVPTTERLLALANKHPYSIDWLLTGHGEMDQAFHLSEPLHKLLTRVATMTEREQYRVIRMVEALADDTPANDCDEPGPCGKRNLAG